MGGHVLFLFLCCLPTCMGFLVLALWWEEYPSNPKPFYTQADSGIYQQQDFRAFLESFHYIYNIFREKLYAYIYIILYCRKNFYYFKRLNCFCLDLIPGFSVYFVNNHFLHEILIPDLSIALPALWIFITRLRVCIKC